MLQNKNVDQYSDRKLENVSQNFIQQKNRFQILKDYKQKHKTLKDQLLLTEFYCSQLKKQIGNLGSQSNSLLIKISKLNTETTEMKSSIPSKLNQQLQIREDSNRLQYKIQKAEIKYRQYKGRVDKFLEINKQKQERNSIMNKKILQLQRKMVQQQQQYIKMIIEMKQISNLIKYSSNNQNNNANNCDIKNNNKQDSSSSKQIKNFKINREISCVQLQIELIKQKGKKKKLYEQKDEMEKKNKEIKVRIQRIKGQIQKIQQQIEKVKNNIEQCQNNIEFQEIQKQNSIQLINKCSPNLHKDKNQDRIMRVQDANKISLNSMKYSSTSNTRNTNLTQSNLQALQQQYKNHPLISPLLKKKLQIQTQSLQLIAIIQKEQQYLQEIVKASKKMGEQIWQKQASSIMEMKMRYKKQVERHKRGLSHHIS